MKSKAITTEELVFLLGISLWRTTIHLPADSYTVELCEFTGGKVTRSVVVCTSGMAGSSREGITVMIGDGHSEYRAAIRFSNGAGSCKWKTEYAMFEETSRHIDLPAKVGLGDFVLQVQCEHYYDGTELDDMPSSARGLLLRIQKA